MLVRMPDTALAIALLGALLIVGVIVHLVRQLRDARRHIAEQAAALRLQAIEEGIGPHLRTVGPPCQLSIVDGLRITARRHAVGTVATVLAALGVAAALLLPDGTPVENAAPDPDPPRTAPAPSPPERRVPSSVPAATTTTSAAQAVTTTAPARHEEHYSGTVAASARPRRASSSTAPASSAPAPASNAQPCMLCDVVGMLLAA